MKLTIWIVIGILVEGIAFGVIASPNMPRGSVFVFLVVVIFLLPPFGGFWMIYMAIRYERHPLTTILLAFLPYTFVWYYFERVRPNKHLSRDGFA